MNILAAFPKYLHLEDAAVILPGSSVSPGPYGSDEPPGSTALTDPVGPT